MWTPVVPTPPSIRPGRSGSSPCCLTLIPTALIYYCAQSTLASNPTFRSPAQCPLRFDAPAGLVWSFVELLACNCNGHTCALNISALHSAAPSPRNPSVWEIRPRIGRRHPPLSICTSLAQLTCCCEQTLFPSTLQPTPSNSPPSASLVCAALLPSLAPSSNWL